MEQIAINNGTYCIQRVFSGSQDVAQVIQSRICAQIPSVPPLTQAGTMLYNHHGDGSAERRYHEN